jgi:hypothetical protein
MSSDPTMNVIVFAIKRQGKEDTIANQVRTQAPDGVKTAWAKARQSHGVEARDVHEIYSEWEPSQEDEAFIDQHFPNVKVSYSFKRPADGNWAKAFAEVRGIIEASLQKDAQKKTGASALLPILRNADQLTQVMVHQPLGSTLALCLARVKTTPEGRIGIDYVMTASVKETPDAVQTLWKEGLAALTQGLQVSVGEHQGDQFFMVNRREGFAASALGLPDFFANAASWIKSPRIAAAILDPNTICLCAADRAIVRHLEEMVINSPYQGSINLTPCLLILDKSALTMQMQRPTL